MSEAVLVHNAYKKFGGTNLVVWKRQSERAGYLGWSEHSAEIVAVDHVSFSIRQGEIFGILGPHGSGKSTLIRLLATLLLPDAGDLRVFGYDVVRQPVQVQRLINRVSVEASFFKKLSPMENLLYGVHLHEGAVQAHRQVVEILTRLGMEESAIYQPMREMSRAMQQKVVSARALLSRPRLLLLDEPTAGQDGNSTQQVHEIVRELRDQCGTTILVSTRDRLEAEALCDRIALIEGGKIMAVDTPAGLKRMIPRIEYEPALDEVFLNLTSQPLVKEEV
jgi:ABC-2 type transport system ATP-binding protein